jgi:hypothetical protein
MAGGTESDLILFLMGVLCGATILITTFLVSPEAAIKFLMIILLLRSKSM